MIIYLRCDTVIIYVGLHFLTREASCSYNTKYCTADSALLDKYLLNILLVETTLKRASQTKTKVV